jgi:hypothetical protein
MRCLYCDGKLPLYRKITHGQFCSTAHRKAYWQEQERLAVERLHQTHTSLKAYRPPVSVESILGRDPGAAELSGFVAAVLYPQSQGAPRMLVADPLAYDLERIPGKLEWNLAERPVRSAPSGSLIRLFREWSSTGMAGNGVAGPRGVELAPKIALPQAARPPLNLSLLNWTGDSAPASVGPVPIALSAIAPSPITVSPQPFASRMPSPVQHVGLSVLPATPEMEPRPEPSVESTPPAAEGFFALPRLQAREFALTAEPPRQMLAAEPLAVALPLAVFPDRGVGMAVGLPGPVGAVPLPVSTLGAQAARPVPAAAENVRALASAAAPLAFPDHGVGKAVGLPGPMGAVPFPVSTLGAQAARPVPAAAERLILAAEPLAVALPLAMFPDRRVGMAVGLPGPIGAVPLPVSTLGAQAARPVPAAAENVRALASAAAPEPLQVALALTQRQPRLAMGRGSRYPIAFRTGGVPGAAADPIDFPSVPADIMLPAPPAPSALEPAASWLDTVVPEPLGLVSLKVQFGPSATKPAAPLVSNVATIPQPLRTEHILPSSRLEPLDTKPVADLMQPEGEAPASAGSAAVKLHPWSRAAGLWKLAPRDLRILAFAIPALLTLAFHRELPKVHFAATPPSTGEFRKNLKTVVNTHWTNFRQAVVDRAAVSLDEDFRSGLDDWASRSDATADWSFDAAGFVRPGPLALYRPSMNLTDYQVQFLGMIDKKALSWVVRAANFDNYYVIKLVVLKPGPRTTVGLTRYAVIHGKAVDRVDTVVPMEAQPDTLYRVRLELDGDNFTLTVQGQMVDSWSEPRLPKGGIGFFTAHGEESRIRWVALTHQYDILGRLCAYLAPYETATTNGSW